MRNKSLLISRRCDWCHTAVLIGTIVRGETVISPTTCPECGHRADVPHDKCNCPQCRPKSQGGEA